jgi:hypothetical protein
MPTDHNRRGTYEAEPARVALEEVASPLEPIQWTVGSRAVRARAVRALESPSPERVSSVALRPLPVSSLRVFVCLLIGPPGVESIESPLQLGASHSDEGLGEGLTAAREESAVRHHHEEGMVVLRVLITQVLREIGVRVALEHVRQIERDGLAESKRRLSRQRSTGLRDHPHEEHRLHHEHRGEKGHDANGDPPVKTAIPLHHKSVLRGLPAVTIFSYTMRAHAFS